MSSTATASNTTAPTQYVTVGDNTYAYRQFGSRPGAPLLFLQHFTLQSRPKTFNCNARSPTTALGLIYHL